MNWANVWLWVTDGISNATIIPSIPSMINTQLTPGIIIQVILIKSLLQVIITNNCEIVFVLISNYHYYSFLSVYL